MATVKNQAVETTPAVTISQLSAGMAPARVKKVIENAEACALAYYSDEILVLPGMSRLESLLWAEAKLQAIAANAYSEAEAKTLAEALKGSSTAAAVSCKIIKAAEPMYEEHEDKSGNFRKASKHGLRGKQLVVVEYPDGSTAQRFITGFQKEACDARTLAGGYLPRFVPVFVVDQPISAKETVSTYFSEYTGDAPALKGKHIKRTGVNLTVAAATVENFIPSAEALAAYAEKSEDC